MIGLTYKDTITLIDQDFDGYGDEIIRAQAEVGALFHQTTGQMNSQNTTVTNSDAHVYVDPDNAFIKENAYRLEGMLIKANPFNSPESEVWYKVTVVVIGQDKLLTNKIDNVHLYLSKTRKINGI